MSYNVKDQMLKTKRGIYGIFITVISLAAFLWILSAKEDAINEYEKLKNEGTCFAEKVDDSWNNMNEEEKKKQSRLCMAASNRLSQTKYGPVIFGVLLGVGILLSASALIPMKSQADRALEEFEEEEKKNDSKLS